MFCVIPILSNEEYLKKYMIPWTGICLMCMKTNRKKFLEIVLYVYLHSAESAFHPHHQQQLHLVRYLQHHDPNHLDPPQPFVGLLIFVKEISELQFTKLRERGMHKTSYLYVRHLRFEKYRHFVYHALVFCIFCLIYNVQLLSLVLK